MKEEWLPCPGFENYQVSSKGNIRRLKKTHMGDVGSLLVPWLHGGRYLIVKLNSKRVFVHRLVCEAFHGQAPVDKPMALHRDDNRMNNTKENLYWGDNVDNGNDRFRNGLAEQLRGERNPNNKLNPDQVHEIRRHLIGGMTERAAAAIYNVSKGTVRAIKTGRTWRDTQ